MWKRLLALIGGISILAAFIMWFCPLTWYNNTPGVSKTGPINYHFVRDISLSYLVSGVALIWGARTYNKSVCIFGSLWLCLHALFHVWIWFHRGMSFDTIALTNLIGIQLPAVIAMISSLELSKSGEKP